MAYCDYIHCAVCNSKTIYDAEVNYDYSDGQELISLCAECNKKYEIVVRNRDTEHIPLKLCEVDEIAWSLSKVNGI